MSRRLRVGKSRLRSETIGLRAGRDRQVEVKDVREEITTTVLGVTLLGWICAGLLAFAGLYRVEPELKNPRKIETIAKGMERGAISVTQPAPDQPLAVAFDRAKHPQQFTNAEWQEIETSMRRFVAASNWGLSAPFKYDPLPGSTGQVAVSFKTDEFTYTNPFGSRPLELTGILIKSADGVGKSRKGWRVIGPNFSLFLKPDAAQREAVVEADGGTKEGTTLVAQQFRLRAPPGRNSLQLSVSPSANADDQSTTLRVTLLDAANQPDAGRRFKSGEYFFWEGQAFTAYEVGDRATPAPAPGALGDALLAHDDLIVTKRINGRASRVHLLNQSTANLIGVRVGGYLPLLDGAIDAQTVGQVRLTLDPDLQSTSFHLLTSVLKELDGRQRIGRRRRGSLAVLDADNGAILALSGYPSLDADWIEQRRVLIDRDKLVRASPALEKHMPGSAVKVMTVALGYLLDGAARGELLPTSRNGEAVRQAFQDVYGVALKAPLDGDKARPTDAARDEFNQVRSKSGMREGWAQVLREAFRVAPILNGEQHFPDREEIVRGNVASYFDQNRLRAAFPVTSVWPAQDADSMDRLRLHALGSEEAQFTTMRLAAILGTAATGRRFDPYLVESIRRRDGAEVKFDQTGVSEPNLLVPDSGRHISTMRQAMPGFLHQVLIPGGTGSFFLDSGTKQFLGLDDPTTQGIDEARLRADDYGKSGTAAYEEQDNLRPDSIFVYRHGHYLIAVWLEQSDFGTAGQSMGGWSDNPAHKVVHRLVQTIEAFEHHS